MMFSEQDLPWSFYVKLLALDTSTEACSVALYVDGDVLALDEVCPQQHSKRILPMVQQILAQAQLNLSQLDGLVFGRGPGSFTGVRIGVGVVQGLAFGIDRPVYGVSTLQAMAQASLDSVDDHVGAALCFSAIDARMAEIYCAAFLRDAQGVMQPLSAEMAIKPAQLAAHLTTLLPDAAIAEHIDCAIAGTGWQSYAEILRSTLQNYRPQLNLQGWSSADLNTPAQPRSSLLLPSARHMFAQALPAWQQGAFVAAELAEPVYVRDEVTWQKLPGR